jgi:hypothetical protein
MTRGGVALAAAVLAIALTGCESTEQESAQIAKRLGRQTADAAVTQIKTTNSAVSVRSAQIVRSKAGIAAAIELKNTSGKAEADIPILITAYDAGGKAVYSNATVGVSSPLGELSLIGPGATVWWVDPNVLASGGAPVRVSARIGASTATAPTTFLSTNGFGTGSSFIGSFISGRASNAGGTVAADVTLYAVALEGSRVVAAGQSLVPTLAAHGASTFQVGVIGNPKGATYVVTAVPPHIG